MVSTTASRLANEAASSGAAVIARARAAFGRLRTKEAPKKLLRKARLPGLAALEDLGVWRGTRVTRGAGTIPVSIAPSTVDLLPASVPLFSLLSVVEHF
jgi:hypothetical protein